MKFILREKMISVRDAFRITDENGELAYTITSRILALRKTFVLERPDGTNVAVAKKQILRPWRQYGIRLIGDGRAKLRRAFYRIGFGPKFVIRSPRGRMVAEGNFLEHEYAFERGGKKVAEASKHWVAMTDTYGVEVDDPDDAPLVLCCVVLIDTLLEREDADEKAHNAKHM